MTAFATAPDGTGLGVRVVGSALRVELDGRVVAGGPVDAACGGQRDDGGVRIDADGAGVRVDVGGRVTELPGEPVPRVSAFRTDLGPPAAAGLGARATTASPWESTPTPAKLGLLGALLAAVASALVLLRRSTPTRVAIRPDSGGHPPRLAGWGLDGGVVGGFLGWTVIGPLTDDDGFATAIARSVATTGDAGNGYRWWNASETPFALSQQLLAPLTELSLAPVWLSGRRRWWPG